MKIFEFRRKEETGEKEDVIVPAETISQEEIEALEKEKFDELVASIQELETQLEEVKVIENQDLKVLRMKLIADKFKGLNLEERFSKLEEIDEEKVSEQFLRLVEIKKTIENAEANSDLQEAA